MQLLTQAIKAKLPPLYATDAQPEDRTSIVVKFFTPDSSWTWYVTEGSPVVIRDGEHTEVTQANLQPGEAVVDWRFFGLVDGLDIELGYFMLSELQRARGPLGLPIERDMHFRVSTLADVRQACELRVAR